MWNYWVYSPEGNLMVEMLHAMVKDNKSGLITARTAKGAARKVRKQIDRAIQAKERRKVVYP